MKEDTTEKMSFEPKLKGSERVSHATIWRKSILGRRKGKSKSLQEEAFWSSENKEGGVVGRRVQGDAVMQAKPGSDLAGN